MERTSFDNYPCEMIIKNVKVKLYRKKFEKTSIILAPKNFDEHFNNLENKLSDVYKDIHNIGIIMQSGDIDMLDDYFTNETKNTDSIRIFLANFTVLSPGIQGLLWIISKGYVPDNILSSLAAFHNRIDILEFLYNNNYRFSENILDDIYIMGDTHTNIRTWLESKGFIARDYAKLNYGREYDCPL